MLLLLLLNCCPVACDVLPDYGRGGGGHQSLCCPDVVLQIYTNLSHCIARQQQMWAGNAAFTWQMRIFNAINDLAQQQTFCSALHTLQIGKGVQGV